MRSHDFIVHLFKWNSFSVGLQPHDDLVLEEGEVLADLDTRQAVVVNMIVYRRFLHA